MDVLADLHRAATIRGATLYVARADAAVVSRPLRAVGMDRLLVMAPWTR